MEGVREIDGPVLTLAERTKDFVQVSGDYGGGGGGSSLACEDYGERFDELLPACTFFLLFF